MLDKLPYHLIKLIIEECNKQGEYNIPFYEINKYLSASYKRYNKETGWNYI